MFRVVAPTYVIVSAHLYRPINLCGLDIKTSDVLLRSIIDGISCTVADLIIDN